MNLNQIRFIIEDMRNVAKIHARTDEPQQSVDLELISDWADALEAAIESEWGTEIKPGVNTFLQDQ